MKKNICFLGLLVCVLVSCDTPTSGKNDTWSYVTSLEQLDGTWKGTYKQKPMPIKEAVELLGETWNDGMELMFGNMKATVSAAITYIINASEKTRSGAVETTMTFSDGTIKTTWGLIKTTLIEYIPDGTTFDDKNHSITLPEEPIPEQSLTDEEIEELLSSGLQINQDGNKIKIPETRIPAGAISEDFPEIIITEIIMTRQ